MPRQMQPLDYQTSQSLPPPAPISVAAVIALAAPPIVSLFLLVFVALHNMQEEPFGGFRTEDAVIQVGLPAVVIIAWVVWFFAAFAKRRLPWQVLIALACWGVLNVAAAQMFIAAYFHEPWNTPTARGDAQSGLPRSTTIS